MNWIFKKKQLLSPIPGAYGFVYKLTCNVEEYKNYIYIGSKTFFRSLNVRLSKKKSNLLYKGVGRKPTKEKVSKESNWLTYTTSSNIVNDIISKYGIEAFKAEIIDVGSNKSDLLLREIEQQIKYKVFRIRNSFNVMLKASIYKTNII